MLCNFLRLPLSNLVVPFLAQRHECGEFIRHIGIYKGVLLSLDNPDLRAFRRAEGFQSRSAGITWNSQ